MGGDPWADPPHAARSPHRPLPEPSGRAEAGDENRRRRSPGWGRTERQEGRRSLLGGGKEEDLGEVGRGGTQPGNTRTNNVRGLDRSGRMERELDHWQRGSGVLTL